MTPRFHSSRAPAALSGEGGFTMIIAIGVMFVTSLLLVAAFTVANSEVAASHNDLTQKQAYYAALAGIQEYEYQLQANPSYWEKCSGPKSSLPEEKNQRYEVEVLAASTSPEGKCNPANPFATAIEGKGALSNTFRVESTGYSGSEKKSIVSTFKVAGFLDYVYFTNFETEDPSLYAAPAGCKGKYYKEWNPLGTRCSVITFANGDNVKGPMHTNDAAKVEGAVTFGRNAEERKERLYDAIEINGGTHPEDENEECKSGEATFNTESKCYTTKGEKLEIPPGDTSLTAYVKPEYKLSGQVRLVLKGASNTIEETYFVSGKEEHKTLAWPSNGLIYVAEGSGCSYPFHPWTADTAEEVKETEGCGTAYVSGTYSEPLTIATENNLVVTGNIYPTSVEGKLGSAPTGTATLGLIAKNYVRMYHPVDTGAFTVRTENECRANNLTAKGAGGKEDPNGWGTQNEPWIYAAILSTSHSWLVDNWECGSQLANLNVYGAIAQDYRGIVGTIGNSGYTKDYKYDDRLATDEPPYFLAPLKAGWKIIRQTATSPG